MTTKLVKDLLPGDVLPVTATRTVKMFQRDANTATVTFTDGSAQTWSLDGSPAVEVVDISPATEAVESG